MNKGIRVTDEFKQDAVAQVIERGYSVSEVAERLGISTKSLNTWKSQLTKSPRIRAETRRPSRYGGKPAVVADNTLDR